MHVNTLTMLTNLTAPLKQAGRWESLVNVSNSTFLASTLSTSFVKRLNITDINHSNNSRLGEYTNLGYRLLTPNYYCNYPDIFNYGYSLYTSPKYCKMVQAVSGQLMTVSADLKQIDKWLSFKDCTSLVFYITSQREIKETITHLRKFNSKSPYYSGKEGIFPQAIGWDISKVGPGMINRLNLILSSGIYNLFQGLAHLQKHLQFEHTNAKFNERKFTPQSLDSNWVVVFYIYLSCIFVCGIEFFGELVCYELNAMKRKIYIYCE